MPALASSVPHKPYIPCFAFTCSISQQVPASLRQDVLPVQGTRHRRQLLCVGSQQVPDAHRFLQFGEVDRGERGGAAEAMGLRTGSFNDLRGSVRVPQLV